jgi:uncharacterized protein with HEPN domain
MPRDFKLYLEDMAEAIKKIQRYTLGLSLQQFSNNEQVVDAVVRNLEVIGEAVKRIPEEMCQRDTSIEWRKIAGLWDILAHEYFGIDAEIIWDFVWNKLPSLEKNIHKLLADSAEGSG